MGSEDPDQNVFNHYEGMDTDDINYVHRLNHESMRNIMHQLPPGWKRHDPKEGPGPPYIHEPTGKTSWKNPNLEKLMAVVNTSQENKRKDVTEDATVSSKQVKKLRLMLQAGAPLGAVEQKAKLEGIDMSLVLSPSSGAEEMDGDSKKDPSVVSDDEGEEGNEKKTTASIPETLVKKYKRMFKAGVPMDRVKQLAGLETGTSPEQVEAIIMQTSPKNSSDEGSEKKQKNDNEKVPKTNPRMAKFLRMQKAGIPLAAIENSARLQGHDMNELSEALGVKGTSGLQVDEKKDKEPKVDPRMTKYFKMQKARLPIGAIEQAATIDGVDIEDLREALGVSMSESKVAGFKKDVDMAAPTRSTIRVSNPYFTLQEGGVAFPSSHGGNGAAPLTDLVRKMVQTVQKSQFGICARKEMVVDELTLFDALGTFKGVQFARDEYNSTVGVQTMEKELVRSKRHGFVEMATSIGMTLSSNTTHVDIEGLDELVKHVESVNSEQLERGRALLKDGYYDFDSIHTLYQPGSYVIAKHAGGGGVDCFCQVVWMRYNQGRTISGKTMKYFQLSCRFISPVGGGKSTFAEVVEGIEMFEGRRSLSASFSGAGLSFVPPLEPEVKGLLQKYRARGELYNKIVSIDDGKTHSYMEYEKGSFFQKTTRSFNAGKSSTALANAGRVVIDFDAASDNGHSISVGRDDMIDGFRMQVKQYKLFLRLLDKHSSSGDKSGGSPGTTGSMVLFSQVPTEYLNLVLPITVGFSLTSKSWGDVVIDGINEITFDQDVFDRLVLPDSRKRMIKALVKHTCGSGFHDLVAGKGEGTVFLLYGPPGVGKTLTAEAIAESLHRPLYSVSMGAMGTTADELERRLSEILELSARWDALVLLDEADSYLEARSSSSPLERNAMVAVMLRLVEYHRGILFLTSNRIDSLDPAFQTRITLALRYDPLDVEGRTQVWRNLLLKSGESLDRIDAKALAETALNGREVKNALRLAMALAADEDGVLSQELLLETVEVVNGHKQSMKFDWDENVKSRGWFSSWWG